MLTLSIAALLLQTTPTPATAAGARNPSYSRDGRLAVSVQGDLWIVSTHGEWTRLTSGPAWDREPAWTPDGAAIVFSSDRAGNFDLWRVRVGPNGASGDAERVTDSPLREGPPTVDGHYVNLVSARHAESAWNPDGKTIALAEISSDAIPPVGYNGDPDRTDDREANLLGASSGKLWTVEAPSSPDQQLAEQAGTPAF